MSCLVSIDLLKICWPRSQYHLVAGYLRKAGSQPMSSSFRNYNSTEYHQKQDSEELHMTMGQEERLRRSKKTMSASHLTSHFKTGHLRKTLKAEIRSKAKKKQEDNVGFSEELHSSSSQKHMCPCRWPWNILHCHHHLHCLLNCHRQHNFLMNYHCHRHYLPNCHHCHFTSVIHAWFTMKKLTSKLSVQVRLIWKKYPYKFGWSEKSIRTSSVDLKKSIRTSLHDLKKKSIPTSLLNLKFPTNDAPLIIKNYRNYFDDCSF